MSIEEKQQPELLQATEPFPDAQSDMAIQLL